MRPHLFAPTAVLSRRVCLLFLVATLAGAPVAAKERPLATTIVPSLHDLAQQRLGVFPATYTRAAAETLSFGNVGGDGFAILGDVWTFDHGGGDPLEGWSGVDMTAQQGVFFRHIDSATWDDDPFHDVPAPVLRGAGSAWVGATATESREACWEAGLGYGNNWAQRLESPVFAYDGSSQVEIGWVHFNDTEEDFDYTLVLLRTLPGGDERELRRYTDQIGLAGDHPASPPVGASDAVSLTAADFAGATEFQVVFVMESEGFWSDEDGLYETAYGPGAFDDVVLENIGPGGADSVSFAFESDLDGWTAVAADGIGTFLSTKPLSEYGVIDLCRCDLDGNVLTLHRGVGTNGDHPEGQWVRAVSPPVDVENDVLPMLGGTGDLSIFVDWEQYSLLPRANGVFFRGGGSYYPWTCPITGAVGWSPRVGSNVQFFFTGDDPECSPIRSFLTGVSEPVPPDAEQIRFLYELYASCDAFAIPPSQCTGETNFTPLVDNVEVRFTRVPRAPAIAFNLGGRFQDGFAQGTNQNDPTRPGRADVSWNQDFGNNEVVVLGDSLSISGPIPTNPSNRWEAKLWFRLPRVGPLSTPAYATWRDRVADGFAIDPALAGGGTLEFTWARMDSCQLGTQVFRHRFASYFREDDDDFNPGAGELSDGNEILADNVLFPGTQVEYFVTGQYLGESQYVTLPDTSGGFLYEFEILPRWREENGDFTHPRVLYVDASESNAQVYMDDVLARVFGEGEVDRYDYLDPSSGWKPPLARGSGPSNNGARLGQLVTGYDQILLGAGSRSFVAWPEDWELLDSWVKYPAGWEVPRALWLNGDAVAHTIVSQGPMLAVTLGLGGVASPYREVSGNAEDCVELEAPLDPPAAYPTVVEGEEYDHDAFGNGCPDLFDFDVLTPAAPGVGNRVYIRASDGAETGVGQIVRDGYAGVAPYRTVLDGVSWHHMALRDPEGSCQPSYAEITGAIEAELRAAIAWMTEGASSTPPSGAAPGDRLLAARPNPFPQEARISFQLATPRFVRLDIHDAQGRRVRELLAESRAAGPHTVTWDGRDDRGHELSSGVYWYRLSMDGFEEALRIVRLR